MSAVGHRERLARITEAAPSHRTSVDAFIRFLNEHEVDVQECGDARLSDLYLACGCSAEDEGAVAEFEQAFGPLVRRVVRQTLGEHAVDDVTQRLLAHLLVPSDASSQPRIAKYMGTGSLRAFVRMTASRFAIDVRRAASSPPAAGNSRVEKAAAPHRDPLQLLEDDQTMQHLGPALGKALESLKPIERRALRMRFVLGFSVGRTAVALNIHENSVSRIVARARQRIMAQLMDIPEVPSTPEAVAGLAATLDVSVSRHLQSHPDPDQAS